MNDQHSIMENAAARAFNLQATEFDRQYGKDTIINYKRARVRAHIGKFLPDNSYILELNAGTGEDALYFASRGHRIHATDIAEKMLEVLDQKLSAQQAGSSITHELCSFTDLKSLKNKGPYDLVFSNFAGLNCTNDLKRVLDSFDSLLKPNGIITLVVLPKFCLWEFLLLFRGKFKTAFRRFAGKKGARAKINNTHFRCWYYNSSFIRKHLKNSFDVLSVEGLCSLVPPSYLQGFAEKHPRLYQSLVRKENKWKSHWPWRAIGDYYIITLQKK